MANKTLQPYSMRQITDLIRKFESDYIMIDQEITQVLNQDIINKDLSSNLQ